MASADTTMTSDQLSLIFESDENEKTVTIESPGLRNLSIYNLGDVPAVIGFKGSALTVTDPNTPVAATDEVIIPAATAYPLPPGINAFRHQCKSSESAFLQISDSAAR